MFIENIEINNFRLLNEVSLTLERKSTVIVGRNNSGKTSLTEIFRRLFSGKSPEFCLEDFSLNSFQGFKDGLQAKLSNEEDEIIRAHIPRIELILDINYKDDILDFGTLSEFIIDLDETNTKARIKISYQLKDGKIDALFYGLDNENRAELFEIIKDRIPKYFNVEITAIDINDTENVTNVEFSKLIHLIDADFINAQRGLDDVTQSEKDVLGKVLSSIFKNASMDTAPEEMKVKSKELELVVKKLQSTVDTEFKEKVDALLPALNLFGYPGLSDPKFTTKTTFDAQTIVESNTKLRYQKSDGISLPETYNGLGSRNLIFILFQIFDFFRKYQSNPIELKSHLVFIEEPEAHLHPQMQEVFIRKLYEIAEEFSNTLNGGKVWPVQFVVSTHSTHIANEASFESIRYFLTKGTEKPVTIVKDLNAEFGKEELKVDREFVHKYLTLTKCDLFFADKALLIEGPTERILIPTFIKKIDLTLEPSKLGSQYISVIEIGGAYAHHFYKFLDFLELKSLIITDLDSVKQDVPGEGHYKACQTTLGTHSSNAGIKNWYKEKEENIDLGVIRSKIESEKIQGTRRLAFQIPEIEKTACGRSFEDAFVIANLDIFGISNEDEVKVEELAYDIAKQFVKKKTDFALKYAVQVQDWNVPNYIIEGLTWLAHAKEEIVAETTHASK